MSFGSMIRAAGRFLGTRTGGLRHRDPGCRDCPVALECSLDAVRQGSELVVLGVDDESARIHALRFGIAEGACVRCVTRIPAGPIVLRSGRQEIAIGRNLARRIRVRHQEPDCAPEGSAA